MLSVAASRAAIATPSRRSPALPRQPDRPRRSARRSPAWGPAPLQYGDADPCVFCRRPAYECLAVWRPQPQGGRIKHRGTHDPVIDFGDLGESKGGQLVHPIPVNDQCPVVAKFDKDLGENVGEVGAISPHEQVGGRPPDSPKGLTMLRTVGNLQVSY